MEQFIQWQNMIDDNEWINEWINELMNQVVFAGTFTAALKRSLWKVNCRLPLVPGWEWALAAQEKSGVASLEKDAQLLKKMVDGRSFSGTALSGHGTGNAHKLHLCVGVPSTKSFGRKGDKLDPYPLAFVIVAPHFSLLRMLQGVAWFSGGAQEEGDLEGVDDSDVEGCVSSLDPGW
jgi:hypothetical protein